MPSFHGKLLLIVQYCNRQHYRHRRQRLNSLSKECYLPFPLFVAAFFPSFDDHFPRPQSISVLAFRHPSAHRVLWNSIFLLPHASYVQPTHLVPPEFRRDFYTCTYSRNYKGCLIMFSVIKNIYNKKTKGPTLMELFTDTEKLRKFF
jgi:hypothetical protein